MRSPTLLAFLALLLGSTAAPAVVQPRPDAMVNCSDGPVALGPNTALSLTLSLIPGIGNGLPADWWLVAATPLGLYYDTPSGDWKPATQLSELQPVYQGPLFDLPSIEALNVAGLPPGDYSFYFGVDILENGQLDIDLLRFDSVEVIISASSASSGNEMGR